MDDLYKEKIRNLKDDYFYRMFSPVAMEISDPYHIEEGKIIEDLLLNHASARNMNFVSIGAGALRHLRYALRFTYGYVGVEPSLKNFLNEDIGFLIERNREITLVDKKFEMLEKKDLPFGNCFYVFLFNIFPYLEDPFSVINRFLKKGDVILLSTWNRNENAMAIRKRYFDYLNSFEEEAVIDPEKDIILGDWSNFNFDSLDHYQNHKIIKGDVTDILIIYS